MRALVHEAVFSAILALSIALGGCGGGDAPAADSGSASVSGDGTHTLASCMERIAAWAPNSGGQSVPCAGERFSGSGAGGEFCSVLIDLDGTGFDLAWAERGFLVGWADVSWREDDTPMQLPSSTGRATIAAAGISQSLSVVFARAADGSLSVPRIDYSRIDGDQSLTLSCNFGG